MFGKGEYIADSRRTSFVCVRRVMLAERMSFPTTLVGNRRVQPREINPVGQFFDMVPGSRLIVDFGRELAGGVRVVTGDLGEQGGRVRIRFGESVSETMREQERCHSIRVEELTLPNMGCVDFGNTGFRFVSLEAMTSLKLVNVIALFRYREVEQLGQFECDDERLNTIWQTCVDTVHLNMQEYLLDGIKRDRLVWQGDMHPELAVVNCVFGEQEIARESLDFSRDMTPLPQWMNDVSAYSLWWILCQFDFFMYHGNLMYLKQQQRYLRGLVKQLLGFIGKDGREMLPDIRFIDWPTKFDALATHVGLQALMVSAFKAAGKLAVYLQDSELAQDAVAALHKLLAYTIPITERKAPNGLAVLAGLMDAETCNRERLSAAPCHDLGTFMGYYVLKARCMAGDLSGALDVIRTYWGGMLDLGATSFWEHFDMEWLENGGRIDELPDGRRRDVHGECGDHCYVGVRHSLCHGWAGGPAELMLKEFMGVRMLEPGFRKISLVPPRVNLGNYHCCMPTPYGLLEVRHEGTSNQREVKVPSGIELIE